MTTRAKILAALPLLLLSAGVILLFNGLLEALVLLFNPGVTLALDLGFLTAEPIAIEPARLWPWLLIGGAVLFVGGMTTRR